MKNVMKKISNVLRIMFGYGITICLFLGGLTFLGYVVALVVGGEKALSICEFIYKTFFPIVIKASNIFVLIGLVAMYFSGEASLKMNKKRK